MTKKTTKFMGREALLSPFSSYKREILKFEDGNTVYVRELSGKTLLEFQNMSKKFEGRIPTGEEAMNVVAFTVIHSLCDEKGNLFLTEADMETVLEYPFSFLNKVSEKALELSGVDIAKAKEVAANLKNAEQSPSTEI
jgi:hypothetical protein